MPGRIVIRSAAVKRVGTFLKSKTPTAVPETLLLPVPAGDSARRSFAIFTELKLTGSK